MPIPILSPRKRTSPNTSVYSIETMSKQQQHHTPNNRISSLSKQRRMRFAPFIFFLVVVALLSAMNKLSNRFSLSPSHAQLESKDAIYETIASAALREISETKQKIQTDSAHGMRNEHTTARAIKRISYIIDDERSSNQDIQSTSRAIQAGHSASQTTSQSMKTQHTTARKQNKKSHDIKNAHTTNKNNKPLSHGMQDAHTHTPEPKYDDTVNKLDARFAGTLPSNPLTLHENTKKSIHDELFSSDIFLENDPAVNLDHISEMCASFDRGHITDDSKYPTLAGEVCEGNRTSMVDPSTNRQYKIRINPTRAINWQGGSKAVLIATAQSTDSNNIVPVVVKLYRPQAVSHGEKGEDFPQQMMQYGKLMIHQLLVGNEQHGQRIGSQSENQEAHSQQGYQKSSFGHQPVGFQQGNQGVSNQQGHREAKIKQQSGNIQHGNQPGNQEMVGGKGRQKASIEQRLVDSQQANQREIQEIDTQQGHQKARIDHQPAGIQQGDQLGNLKFDTQQSYQKASIERPEGHQLGQQQASIEQDVGHTQLSSLKQYHQGRKTANRQVGNRQGDIQHLRTGRNYNLDQRVGNQQEHNFQRGGRSLGGIVDISDQVVSIADENIRVAGETKNMYGKKSALHPAVRGGRSGRGKGNTNSDNNNYYYKNDSNEEKNVNNNNRNKGNTNNRSNNSNLRNENTNVSNGNNNNEKNNNNNIDNDINIKAFSKRHCDTNIGFACLTMRWIAPLADLDNDGIVSKGTERDVLAHFASQFISRSMGPLSLVRTFAYWSGCAGRLPKNFNSAQSKDVNMEKSLVGCSMSRNAALIFMAGIHDPTSLSTVQSERDYELLTDKLRVVLERCMSDNQSTHTRVGDSLSLATFECVYKYTWSNMQREFMKNEEGQWTAMLAIDPEAMYHLQPWGSCDDSGLTVVQERGIMIKSFLHSLSLSTDIRRTIHKSTRLVLAWRIVSMLMHLVGKQSDTYGAVMCDVHVGQLAVVAQPRESTDVRDLRVKIIDVDSVFRVVPVTSPRQEADDVTSAGQEAVTSLGREVGMTSFAQEADAKAGIVRLTLQKTSGDTMINRCKTSRDCSSQNDCGFVCSDGVCVLSDTPERMMMDVFCRDVLMCVLGPSLAQPLCGVSIGDKVGFIRTSSTPHTLREIQERMLTLL